MADDVGRVREVRGLGLQCPYSNCLPQLYTSSTKPCVYTAFAEIREVIDHIWKYHSKLLSCDSCDHRFSTAKRGEDEVSRSQLRALQAKHANNHQERRRDPRETMTEAEDELLKNFNYKGSKNKDTMVQNYESLCRLLFGEGVDVPDPKYNYFVPEWTITRTSRDRGQRNLDYVKMRRLQGSNHVPSNGSEPVTSTGIFGAAAASDSSNWVSSPTAAATLTSTTFLISSNPPNTHLPSTNLNWSFHSGPNPLSLDEPEPGAQEEPVVPMLTLQALASEPDSAYYTASNGVAGETNENREGYTMPYWSSRAPAHQSYITQTGTFLYELSPEPPDWGSMVYELDNLSPKVPDGASG